MGDSLRLSGSRCMNLKVTNLEAVERLDVQMRRSIVVSVGRLKRATKMGDSERVRPRARTMSSPEVVEVTRLRNPEPRATE